MNKTQEALKMAMEYIAHPARFDDEQEIEIYNACKQALAECEQAEPVAYTDEYKNFLEWDINDLCDKACCKKHEAIKLYTSPSKREWKELDIDDRNKIFNKYGVYAVPANFELFRAIEQAVKEKNT